MPSKEQWAEAKRWFVEGEITPVGRRWPSYHEIGRRLGVNGSSVFKKAKRERWGELRALCQMQTKGLPAPLQGNEQGNELGNEPAGALPPANMDAALLNLDAFDVARLGQAKVKAFLDGSPKPRDLRDLAEAAKSFLQTGRLAMGQSTDHIETDLTRALLEAFSRRTCNGNQG